MMEEDTLHIKLNKIKTNKLYYKLYAYNYNVYVY